MRWGHILLLVCFLSVSIPAWAEDDDLEITAEEARELSAPDWQNTIEGIKEQTQELLTENAKLSSEYEFLQDKISTLKDDLAEMKARLKELKLKKQNSAGDFDDDSLRDSPLGAVKQMNKLQEEIDAISAENSELERELADLKEKNRLWNIQVSTLHNRKRDVNLDVNYQEAASDESKNMPDADQAKLQAKLEESLQSEKDLEQALAKLESQDRNTPLETLDLKKKNRDLEDRIKDLKRQIAKQEQMNQKRAVSAKKPKSKSATISAKLVNEKKSLEREVSQLNAQLEEVSKKVELNKEAMEKKRQLMDHVMRLDAQNQEMRAKIDALVNDHSSSEQ